MEKEVALKFCNGEMVNIKYLFAKLLNNRLYCDASPRTLRLLIQITYI